MPLPPTLPSPSQNGQTFPSLWSFVADFPFRPARTNHLSLFLSLFLFLPFLKRNDSCISLIASPPPLSLSPLSSFPSQKKTTCNARCIISFSPYCNLAFFCSLFRYSSIL